MRISDWSSDVCSSDLSDYQPQRRAEDAASDCDPPEGHAVAADWNTFDVHPEQAGYKGERQEDERDQRDDQRALVDLLGPEIGELLVEQGGSLAHRLKLFGHACGTIGCFAQVDRKSTRLHSSH